MSPAQTPTASQRVFDADLERFNAAFVRADAIVTDADGWQGIDETRVPAALLSAYRSLCAFGFANGLL